MTDQIQSNSAHLIAPELKAALNRFPQLDFTDGISMYRKLAADRPPLIVAPELAVVQCEELLIPGMLGQPSVRVLVYRPPTGSAQPSPAVLHIHGGGYILGDPEFSDSSNRSMAMAIGGPVVSVDYRLAPETIYPGALLDCYAALLWMHANADLLGIDQGRVAVAGESAGGGHAAALALHARDHGGPPICFLLLDAPMLDDRTGSASTQAHPYCGEFVWTPEQNQFGWRSLLGCDPGGLEVAEGAVPARVADLTGLPPICITVGALDLFFEENLEFARRLVRAGVPTELHVTPGAYHGFGAAAGSPQVSDLLEVRNKALQRAFTL